MIHRPFLRSAIQEVGDFRIGDFDLQSRAPPLGWRTEVVTLERGPLGSSPVMR